MLERVVDLVVREGGSACEGGMNAKLYSSAGGRLRWSVTYICAWFEVEEYLGVRCFCLERVVRLGEECLRDGSEDMQPGSDLQTDK